MKLVNALVITCALLIGCSAAPKPKFADVAELLCDGLADYEHLHNEILSIKLMMDQGNYVDALKVAYALVQSLDEEKNLKGMNEVRALIFLLESIVKGS